MRVILKIKNRVQMIELFYFYVFCTSTLFHAENDNMKSNYWVDGKYDNMMFSIHCI